MFWAGIRSTVSQSIRPMGRRRMSKLNCVLASISQLVYIVSRHCGGIGHGSLSFIHSQVHTKWQGMYAWRFHLSNHFIPWKTVYPPANIDEWGQGTRQRLSHGLSDVEDGPLNRTHAKVGVSRSIWKGLLNLHVRVEWWHARFLAQQQRKAKARLPKPRWMPTLAAPLVLPWQMGSRYSANSRFQPVPNWREHLQIPRQKAARVYAGLYVCATGMRHAQGGNTQTPRLAKWTRPMALNCQSMPPMRMNGGDGQLSTLAFMSLAQVGM